MFQLIVTGNSVKDLANVMRETAEELYPLKVDAAETEDEEVEAPKPKGKASKTSKSFEDDEDEEVEEDEEEEESEDEDEDEDDEESDDEDDEDEDEDEEEDEVEELEAAPKKKAAAKTKSKKLTVDDVNDACKARAAATGGKAGRTEVLTILKKKFKTESVSELRPEQYQACVDAMAVSQ